MADDPPKGLSKSRLGRTFRLARLATHTSTRFAMGMAKRAVGQTPERHDLEDHHKIATHAADVLGNMKGLAMKAGQIVSYVDEWMPEELKPTYRGVLSKLQAKAPEVPLADMLNVFIDEVGEPPDEVFAEFDEKPVAAASIGQVYRARLPSGEPVAVKIQYPGIDQAIRSDLKNLHVLESVMRASTLGRFDVTQSLNDIKSKILEELDYDQEAKHQERFRALYAGHPTIRVPKVFTRYSNKRVLTTEFVEGQSYQVFSEQADQDLRNRVGETLYEFVYGSLHVHGLFNADPHPGNYLFHDSGEVTFLDFGCVQEFDLEIFHAFRELIVALWEGDTQRVRDGLPAALGYPGDASEEEKDFFYDYVYHLWLPVLEDAPFRFDEAYTKDVFRKTYSGVKLGAKVTFSKGYPDTQLRGLALLNRLQFGFVSILGGLHAEANFHRILKRLFDEL